MKNGSLLARFSILDGLYWGWNASFVGYMTTYMLSCGMSSAALSLVLAAYMLLSFAGAFFWGGQCDRRRTNRRVFLVEFALSVISAMMIYFLAEKHLLLSALLYPVFGFLSSPLGAGIDSWMLREFDRDAEYYGRARAIGSAGYAVSMLICGQLINFLGFPMIPLTLGVFSVLVFAIAALSKEKEYDQNSQHLEPENPVSLLHIAPYIFMIVILFFTGLAVSPINNLKNVLLESVGGNVGTIGIDSFIGVMVQAFFIFISGKLHRIPVYVRLFLMTVLIMGTMLFDLSAATPVLVITGTILSNASYGIMLPTTREITEGSVSGSLKNTAHSLSDAMYNNFSGVLALLYSGVMMDALGAKSVAVLGAGIMIPPVLLSLWAMIRKRRA